MLSPLDTRESPQELPVYDNLYVTSTYLIDKITKCDKKKQ